MLRVGGEVVATAAGAAVLGSPLNALARLANTLGERGVTLEAGHTVLPRSVPAAVPVAAGRLGDCGVRGAPVSVTAAMVGPGNIGTDMIVKLRR